MEAESVAYLSNNGGNGVRQLANSSSVLGRFIGLCPQASDLETEFDEAKRRWFPVFKAFLQN